MKNNAIYRKVLTNLTVKLNTLVCFLLSPTFLHSHICCCQVPGHVFYFSFCNSSSFLIWQMSLQKKLIYLAFLGFFIMIRRRKAATVGQYLTASFSKFVARTSHMTNQRSKSSCLYFIPFILSDNIQNLNMLISKLQIPAASYLMELAAIDWFKDTKRMDNVGRQKNCVAQVTKKLV